MMNVKHVLQRLMWLFAFLGVAAANGQAQAAEMKLWGYLRLYDPLVPLFAPSFGEWIPAAPWDSGPLETAYFTDTQYRAAGVRASITPDGTIHGFATTALDIGPFSDAAGSYVNVGAVLDIEFIDAITFTSDILPIGTPVEATFTATLHDGISMASSAGTPSLGAHAQLNLSGNLCCTTIIDDGGAPLPANDPARTVTQVIHSRVGDPFSVFVELYAWAGVDAGYVSTAPVHGIAEVNASNSAALSLTIQTPGVSFRSDSGFTYVPATPPIPEPGTWAMMAVGVLALLAPRRAHRGIAAQG